MWRIIPITFAVLAFALYEPSCVDEFTPPELESWQTALLQAPGTDESLTPPSPFFGVFPEPETLPLPSQTPVEISTQTAEQEPTVPASDLLAKTASFVSITRAGNDDTQSLLSGGTPLTPPRPVLVDLPTQLPSDPLVPQADLREVTGRRVNMRDGPGLQYPIVARLRRGQEVEVLDLASGWYRLRTTETGQIGWASASLISDSAN